MAGTAARSHHRRCRRDSHAACCRPPRREAFAGARVAAVHGAHEAGPVDLTTETDATAATADPAAGRLAPAREVILDALRDLLLVVCELIDRRAELSDRQYGRRTPGERILTHVVCPGP